MRNLKASHDEGSILLSTFHLLLFLSFLVLSLTAVVQNQVMQLQLVKHGYEAKALIALSETIVSERLATEDVENVTLHFNLGRVSVARETGTRYRFVAILDNNFSSQQSIVLHQDVPADAPEEEERPPFSLDGEDVTDHPEDLLDSDAAEEQDDAELIHADTEERTARDDLEKDTVTE